MNYSFDDFFYFYLVIKHGGFTTASEATKISKSKLSRHIADLEDKFNIQLIERTTRRFKVTPIGQALYEECRKIMNQVQVAENLLLSQTTPIEGIIGVYIHPLIFQSKIAFILKQFTEQHPDLKIKIALTQHPNELCYDSLHVCIAPDLDQYKHPHTTVVDLFHPSFCLVVAPQLIENIIVKHPYDLYQIPRIYIQSQQGHQAWQLKNGNMHISIDFSMQPNLFAEDFLNAYYSAINGLGVANLPYSMVEKDLKSGDLIQILAQWDSGTATVQLIYLNPNTPNRATEQLVKALIYDFHPLHHMKDYDEIA